MRKLVVGMVIHGRVPPCLLLAPTVAGSIRSAILSSEMRLIRLMGSLARTLDEDELERGGKRPCTFGAP